MIKLTKILIAAVLLSTLFISCSIEKRASKALKRIGAKPVLTQLIYEYPELFLTKRDTVWKDTIIYKTLPINVPQYLHDTVFADTVKFCKSFYFNDRKITFYVKNVNGRDVVSYIIKAFKIKIDSVPVEVRIPCPPQVACPDISLLPKPGPTDFQIICKYWSLFSWLFLILLAAWKFFRKYIKTTTGL